MARGDMTTAHLSECMMTYICYHSLVQIPGTRHQTEVNAYDRILTGGVAADQPAVYVYIETYLFGVAM